MSKFVKLAQRVSAAIPSEDQASSRETQVTHKPPDYESLMSNTLNSNGNFNNNAYLVFHNDKDKELCKMEFNRMRAYATINRDDIDDISSTSDIDPGNITVNPYQRRRAEESGIHRRGALTGQTTIRKKIKERLKKIAEERLTVKQIFQRYVESSTLHGFRYACTNTYYIQRFIWACLMILGAIYFIIKLKEGIIEYFEYPFSTLETIEYVETLQFPAISFCLVNNFRVSKLNNSKLKPLYEQNRLPLEKSWKDPGFDIPGAELVEILKNTSFSVDDIFEECDWIKRDTSHPSLPPNYCGTVNFTNYFNNRGQLCYTINSGKPGHRLLSVDHEGLTYGYEFLFDLNGNDALKTVPYSGIRIVLHDQSEPADMNSGFMVSPGFKTFVKMVREETMNLPSPYATHCGEKKLWYFQKYNQKACLLEHLANYTGKKCGCREPFMPDNGFPYCSLQETIFCMFPAKESFNEYEARQRCPIDCESVSYKVKLSDARFIHHPPKGLNPILLRQRANTKGHYKPTHLMELTEKLSSAELDRYIEDNLINVIFFFAKMKKEVHQQEETFDFYQFLGDMGGEIGLMLGASLLTFVEFVDLFIFLIYHQLLRLHKQKQMFSEHEVDLAEEEEEEEEEGEEEKIEENDDELHSAPSEK